MNREIINESNFYRKRQTDRERQTDRRILIYKDKETDIKQKRDNTSEISTRIV